MFLLDERLQRHVVDTGLLGHMLGRALDHNMGFGFLMLLCWRIGTIGRAGAGRENGARASGNNRQEDAAVYRTDRRSADAAVGVMAVPMMVWGAKILSWYAWSSATKSLPLMPLPEGNEP